MLISPRPLLRTSSLILAISRCISMAAITALRASSTVTVGAPKRAINPSPIYLSSVPPCLKMMSDMPEKYRFSNCTTLSGGACSDSRVNPRMSANSTVIVWLTPPSLKDSGC